MQESGPIKPLDYNDVFTAISSTTKGLDVLINFLIDNLKNILVNLSNGDKIATFIYTICASKAALDNEILRVRTTDIKFKKTD